MSGQVSNQGKHKDTCTGKVRQRGRGQVYGLDVRVRLVQWGNGAPDQQERRFTTRACYV